ncbi:MAG: NAD-dependent epimerase/dehydratase family protein [Kofleriaceae bacterium]|nr:NAD-dependent epimerase/dehydratase family protein [Kofleriaceae bacterium]
MNATNIPTQSRVAITGASGLLGGNLAILLREAGHEVVCTKRPSSRIEHLGAFDLQWVPADIGDTDALTKAFEGCDIVYHCAASTSIRKDVLPVHTQANINGTRNVVEAVRSASVRRLVHTSSVVATAISTDGTPVAEEAVWNFPDFGLDDAYSLTKHQSEEIIREAAAEDIDAVIVNPSFMFGPYDAKQSSGRMLIALAKRKIPGFTDGISNYVDVRDVARGMILAAEKGVRGQRYILGNTNLSYQELFRIVAEIAGVKAATRALPHSLAKIGGWAGDLKQRITGRDADINSVTVAYGYCRGNIYSSEKARRDLGYETTPIETAIADSLDWFRAQGVL